MSKWREIRLEDISEYISRGVSPKYVDEGILVLNQKCIRDFSIGLSLARFTSRDKRYPEYKFLRYGDILVNSTGTGTLGRVSIYLGNEPILVDSHITIVRVNEAVSSKFLAYYLHLIEDIIITMGRGATNQQELNKTVLEKLKIQIPDLETQKKIADILSTYDELVENNNRRIEILEKTAEEIYKEWFVRMRFPGHENTKFIKGIPEGWEVKRVGDLGRVETGKTPSTKKEEYYDGNIMFVKTPDMHNNMFTLNTEIYLSKEGSDSQPKKLLPKNSIMVSCIGTGGVVSINGELAHTNQQINSIILKDLKLREWTYFTLKSMKKTIELFGATGATMTNLSKGKFQNLKVLYPTDELIIKFNNINKDIFEEIKNLIFQNQNLIKQRDLLLPRLMNGSIEVK